MIHIPSLKEQTRYKEIVSLKAPEYLYIPLTPVQGKTPEPWVAIGDPVKKYQLLAAAREGYVAHIHSPVSGTLVDIRKHPQIRKKEELTLVIRNDFQEMESPPPPPDPSLLTMEEIRKRIEGAGVLGEGGAEFPAGVKYGTKGKKVDTFIVNGTECEPYLTADYAVMAERTRELFEGMVLVNRVLGATQVVISLEEQNRDLKERFEAFLTMKEYAHIRVVIVPDEYPQGGELQLIYSVTGLRLPKGTIPLEAGIVMSNVGTVYAVQQAVMFRRPVIDRIVTVSGRYAGACGNYEVKIGTPVEHILRETGCEEREDMRVVVGGPMMGKAIDDLSVPVTKGSGGVLLLPSQEPVRLPCIGCGYCVDVCPMNLMPLKYDEFYRKKKYDRLTVYHIYDCIECASCEYICPSNVPLVKSILEGKAKLKEKKDEKQ